jgi:hypothetical protein
MIVNDKLESGKAYLATTKDDIELNPNFVRCDFIVHVYGNYPFLKTKIRYIGFNEISSIPEFEDLVIFGEF